jgi:hypothetical protein
MPNLEDGPVKFKQKTDTIMEELALSNARAKWVLENGYGDEVLKGTSLDAMQGIIEEWGQVQLQQMIADGVPEQQAKAAVVQAIREKFGL